MWYYSSSDGMATQRYRIVRFTHTQSIRTGVVTHSTHSLINLVSCEPHGPLTLNEHSLIKHAD